MAGLAAVTINENEWNVEVASTIEELTTGLSGRASIPAGTGMLFILPATQQVTVITPDMLFPIDIIFISNSVVIDIASNIQPGYEVTEETPCDSFLEVNAGEASLVEAGDAVSVEITSTGGFDWGSIISFAIPLALLGFVSGMVSGMVGSSSHSSSSTEVRRLGRPRTEEERAKVHKEFYGTEELPPRGTGLKEREELEGKKLWYLGEWWEKEYSTAECDVYRSADGKKRLYVYWDGTKKVVPVKEEFRFIGACKIVSGLCHTHGYSVSKVVRCPESPLTDEEWAAAWELAELAYPEGMSNPWVNGWWPETMEEAEKAARAYEWKMRGAIRMFREKQAKAMENYERGADKAAYNYRRYVVGEYETGKELSVVPSSSKHHSMWLTLEQRKDLEGKYGAVAVRWAEEATKPGDIEAADKAAAYYYGKIREYFALGHGSPELSEEQVRKLREVLGLPKEVPPREKGYID